MGVCVPFGLVGATLLAQPGSYMTNQPLAWEGEGGKRRERDNRRVRLCVQFVILVPARLTFPVRDFPTPQEKRRKTIGHIQRNMSGCQGAWPREVAGGSLGGGIHRTCNLGVDGAEKEKKKKRHMYSSTLLISACF